MSELRELSLAAFGDALASGAATPGGGSAAALAGSLAGGLVAMVARLTDGMAEIADEADGLRLDLLALVDEDAHAFDEVMAAFTLPKETEEQKATRSQAIQEGYRSATETPLRVCSSALRVLELAEQVAVRGNPNAVSDAGVAALLAETAVAGAALNARINLGSIKNEEYRSERLRHVASTEAHALALREGVLAAVTAKLG